MKLVLVTIIIAAVSACGTVGGAVGGAGQDLGKVGEWIKSK